jgi:hypothetical protein
MLMINPQHAQSRSLQAHLVLETHCRFRLILYWTRLRRPSSARSALYWECTPERLNRQVRLANSSLQERDRLWMGIARNHKRHFNRSKMNLWTYCVRHSWNGEVHPRITATLAVSGLCALCTYSTAGCLTTNSRKIQSKLPLKQNLRHNERCRCIDPLGLVAKAELRIRDQSPNR